MGFVFFRKILLAPRSISLRMPYPNIVTPASFIAAQAIPPLRPILLLMINGALMPLLRPILLLIVNGVLMPLYCYKITFL